jgi:hypothetical protein
MSRHILVLLCAVALSGAFLLRAQTAPAGVIVWKEIPGHDHVIEIVQGHKEWLALGRKPLDISHVTSAVVDDLDKGIRTWISYDDKTYRVEKPFPSPVDGAGPHSFNIGELKPTGKFRKVAGYSCEEYTGSGESTHWGHSTEVDCVSKDAPGVAEYSHFIKLMNRLYVAAGYYDGSYGNNYPGIGSPQGIDGISLKTTSSTLQGFVVTKIESRTIPASQFEVPTGFQRVEPGESRRALDDIAEGPSTGESEPALKVSRFRGIMRITGPSKITGGGRVSLHTAVGG